MLSTNSAFHYLVTLPRPSRSDQLEQIGEERQQIQRLERSVKRLTWLMLVMCLLLAGIVWQMSGIILSALQTKGG